MLLVLALSATSFAWNTPAKTNYLTFRVAVALPGATLPAGTYIFEALPDHTNIVRVSSRDRLKVYFTGFTYAIERPPHVPRSEAVSFGEPVPGAPMPIRAWYPLGLPEGQGIRLPMRRSQLVTCDVPDARRTSRLLCQVIGNFGFVTRATYGEPCSKSDGSDRLWR